MVMKLGVGVIYWAEAEMRVECETEDGKEE